MTTKWIKVNDLSGWQCSENKNIRFKALLRSDLCDFNYVNIVMKGTIDLLAAAAMTLLKHKKMLHLKI